jgi:murein endopeptidase
VVVEGARLLHALSSPHAPHWQRLPQSGTGFVNHDLDDHGYASSHLVAVLQDAGARYHERWLSTHAGAAPIATNDASRARGGDTLDHESHEAGLDLDLRLPRTDGASGARVDQPVYDRDAARAMILAFAEDARVERILIGDRVLLAEAAAAGGALGKVRDGGPSHENHIHVDVAPPVL